MQRNVALSCDFSSALILLAVFILYVESKFIQNSAQGPSSIMSPIPQSQAAAIQWSKDKQAQILVNCAMPDRSVSSKCSMFLMMRDPYLIPWNSRNAMIRRALAQMNAYEELFSAPNEMELKRRRRSMDMV